MSGETFISALLTTLKPSLNTDTHYVFCSIPGPLQLDIPTHQHLVSSSVLTFHERHRNATTFILPRHLATNVPAERFTYEFECMQITIDVHSGLAAVGFMPVLTGALAERGISCNPISGFYSDHLFVPADRAEEAVRVLEGVRKRAIREVGEAKS